MGLYSRYFPVKIYSFPEEGGQRPGGGGALVMLTVLETCQRTQYVQRATLRQMYLIVSFPDRCCLSCFVPHNFDVDTPKLFCV